MAASTAKRLTRPGPEVTRAEAAAAVTELRDATDRSEAHVRRLTGMGADVSHPAVSVVDRGAWIDRNCATMSALMGPLIEALQERAEHPPTALATAVGSRVTGVQAGSVLSFVSSRVLGQYDVLGPGPAQLLLVAPNIVDAERRLGVDPSDFRLWVCLHEVTHRLQFTAVPWLADHLRSEISAFVTATDLDPDVLKERLGAALKAVVSSLRDTDDAGDSAGEGILGMVQNAEQRAVLDRLTAVMSLIEGHAEYVMDAVGPDVVPSVASIRRKFGQRRKGTSPVDRMLRRLLGLDAKMKQYADGRRFVSGVVDEVGMDGFNAVWTSPDSLPRKDELAAPADWVARVHGRPRAVTA